MIKYMIGAAAILTLSAGYAAAVPAVVETDLNARSGPGTGYGVIATLPEGSTVEVISCDGSWCAIDLGGRTAYASRSYLALGGSGSRVTVVPDYGYGYGVYDPYYSPGYYYGPSIGIYSGPSYRYRYGRRHDGRRDWSQGRGTGQWQGRGSRGAGQQWQGRGSSRSVGSASSPTGRAAAPQVQAPSRGTVGAAGAVGMGRGDRSGSRDRDSNVRGGGAGGGGSPTGR